MSIKLNIFVLPDLCACLSSRAAPVNHRKKILEKIGHCILKSSNLIVIQNIPEISCSNGDSKYWTCYYKSENALYGS